MNDAARAQGDAGSDPRTTLRLTQALAELSRVQLLLDEEHLRRSEAEALFDLVMSSMSDAVVMIDPRGRIVRANAAAYGVFEREPEKLIGEPLRALLGRDVPPSPNAIFRLDPSGHPHAFDVTITVGDKQLPVSLSCAVVNDRFGKVVGALYAARDLSETQRLMRQLEKSERRWRLLASVGDTLGGVVAPAEALPELCRTASIAIGCGVACIVVAEHVVEHVAAWPESHGITQVLQRLRGHPVERSTSLWATVNERRIVHATTLRADFPLLESSGTPAEVNSVALVPLQAHGTAVGSMIVFSEEPGRINDTDVRLVEEIGARVALAVANDQLKQSLARLETAREVARAREIMLAAASHEMQTPLAVLLGFLHTLESWPNLAKPARTSIYGRMSRQARSLRRLVAQFLDYSRLEASRPLDVHPEPTPLGPIIQQVVDDFAPQRSIDVDAPENIPRVMGDPDRIDQVLVNLVSNAIKYSPDGSPVTIEARETEHAIEVSVVDGGRGIAPADLPLLFERFHRGRTAANTKGTGLGLHISRALLSAQKGRLTVSSKLGEGSRFTIVLPSAESGKTP